MKITFHPPSEEAKKAFNLEFQKCAVREYLKEQSQLEVKPKPQDKQK